MDATCIGFTKICPCPYPVSASPISVSKLLLFAYCDALIACANSMDLLNPILFNSLESVFAPIFKAVLAKYILSEYINAFCKFALPE